MRHDSPSANTADAACITAEMRALWNERMLDALDGAHTQLEQQALDEHLRICVDCGDRYHSLIATDAALREQFRAFRSPSPGFDLRLMARIAASDFETQRARRQQEERDHRFRLQQLKNNWRSWLGRNLTNLLGAIATLLIASMAFGTSLHAWLAAIAAQSVRFMPLSRDTGFSLLPIVAMFISMAIATLAIWFTKRNDRRLNEGWR